MERPVSLQATISSSYKSQNRAKPKHNISFYKTARPCALAHTHTCDFRYFVFVYGFLWAIGKEFDIPLTAQKGGVLRTLFLTFSFSLVSHFCFVLQVILTSLEREGWS